MTGVRPSRFARRRKLAALYIVGAHQIGWGIATSLDHLVADPSDAVLHELIPPLWRGGAWLLAGILIIALARTRCPPPGALNAFGYILAWSSLAALIYVIAGWPEHVVERRYGGDQ